MTPTLTAVSKTEHDLTSADTDDALDELFADADFDDALNEALVEADVELDVADSVDSELADRDDDVVDDHDAANDTAADQAELDEADSDDTDSDDTAEDGAVEALAADVDETDLSDDSASDELVGDDDLSDDQLSGDDDTAADAADGDGLDGAAEIVADEDDGTARHGIRAAEVDTDDGDDHGVSSDFELPAIIPATPEDDLSDAPDAGEAVVGAVDLAEARDFIPAGDPAIDDEDVSDDILEELRRADIDGPVVDLAPQDDTATARRRPRRSADYDPAPMPIPAQIPRVLGRKPRVRKVTRVVRHVDPWTVFKIALVASAVLYIIMLTAGVLLWNVAFATGTVDNVERFFESFGWESFTFNGGEIYHAAWIAGLFGVIGLTGLAVLTATLFNLITDLVGGMRFTVLEEEVVETRVSPMRRFVVRRAEPEVPAVLHDQSGSMIREAVVDDTGANERPSR